VLRRGKIGARSESCSMARGVGRLCVAEADFPFERCDAAVACPRHNGVCCDLVGELIWRFNINTVNNQMIGQRVNLKNDRNELIFTFLNVLQLIFPWIFAIFTLSQSYFLKS